MTQRLTLGQSPINCNNLKEFTNMAGSQGLLQESQLFGSRGALSKIQRHFESIMPQREQTRGKSPC